MLGSFLQNSRASLAVPPSISKSSNHFSRLLNHIVRYSQKTIPFLVPGMRYVSFCLCYFILHCCCEYLRETLKEAERCLFVYSHSNLALLLLGPSMVRQITGSLLTPSHSQDTQPTYRMGPPSAINLSGNTITNTAKSVSATWF